MFDKSVHSLKEMTPVVYQDLLAAIGGWPSCVSVGGRLAIFLGP